MVRLAGKCFVASPGDLEWFARDSWSESMVVGEQNGAEAMSQYRVRVDGAASPVRCFADSECVLFVISGTGFIEIESRRFALEPECGACVKPREGFRLVPVGQPLEVLLTVCPQSRAATWLSAPGEDFDETYPERCVYVDLQKREQTGDRYYQVLVDRAAGSDQLTQFIGMIPQSKAPSHFHPYEEVITVLSGHGRMWTGERSTPIGPGSMIYLPRKQAHCVECESAGGMQLIGHFYPAGSPAVRY